MKAQDLSEYAGKKCQIISKMSDLNDATDERAFWEIGIIKTIDHEDQTITVDTKEGKKCFSIKKLFEVLPLEGW